MPVKLIQASLLQENDYIRHDSFKLATLILNFVQEKGYGVVKECVFSTETKHELARVFPGKKCCWFAELAVWCA